MFHRFLLVKKQKCTISTSIKYQRNFFMQTMNLLKSLYGEMTTTHFRIAVVYNLELLLDSEVFIFTFNIWVSRTGNKKILDTNSYERKIVPNEKNSYMPYGIRMLIVYVKWVDGLRLKRVSFPTSHYQMENIKNSYETNPWNCPKKSLHDHQELLR